MNIEDVYPLAPVQQGMLFHVLQAPAGAGVYWAQGIYDFTGRLDVDAMRRAWQVVLDRHTALRTGFVWEEVGEPHQVVLSEVTVPFEALDWSGAGEEEQQRRLDDLLRDDRARGFDLAKPPLTRIYVIDRGDRWWMVWGMFQGLCDGWSLPILLDELHEAYDHHLRGELPRLPPARPYRDFIRWLAEQDTEEATRFWTEYLAGFDEPTPLPVDRVATEHWDQNRYRIELSDETTRGLTALARTARVTLTTVLQAGWALLLARYGGRCDVLFGLTVSGRPAELPGMESMVGLFINTLPLRTTVDDDEPVVDWLRRLQDTQVRMQRHDHTPLTEINRAAPVTPGTPLFDSILVVGNYPHDQRPDAPEEEDATGTLTGLDSLEQGNYPLMLVADLDDRLGLYLQYSLASFDRATGDGLLSHLNGILDAMAAGPELTVGEIPLRPGEVPDEVRLPAVREPVDGSLVSWFEDRVLHGPDTVAIVCDDERVTYRELDERANRLAHLLQDHGARAGRLVALTLPRSADLLTAMIAVLKTGAGYVPVDPEYPADRIELLLSDADPVVVVDAALVERSRACPATPPRAVVDPAGTAYVIYTSGSTGRPKGVAVSHTNVLRLFTRTRKWFGFGTDDVWTMFHSASFDFSVWEIWGALLHGGRVVVVPFTVSRSPERFARLLADERVTMLSQTPSAFYQLMAAGDPPGELALRWVVFGGEALDVIRLAGWQATHPGVELVNMYGITETTVHVTYLPVDADVTGRAWRASPIGEPIDDLSVLVLDDRLRPVVPGMPGEMYVGGGGVALGYLNRPDLTAERFVADPFRPGERLYRTGDRARRSTTGRLEYLGRADEQVKIRGFRIEPGEIRAVLAGHAAVRDVAVVVRDDGPAGRRLVAYLVPETVGGIEVAAVREFAGSRLPVFMLPSAFVLLDDRIPLTANGKVDTRALPAPDASAATAGEYVAPRTDTESALVEIWREVLGLERVGVEDNFFELGGDSILSLQIVARARAVGLRVEIADIFTRQTIGALAVVAVEGGPDVPAVDQGAVSGPVPLTPIEHWFLAQDIADRDHWNWPGVVELGPGVDAGRLSGAFDTLVAHHDALRLRLARDGDGRWLQHNAGSEPHPLFDVVDATGLDGTELDEYVTDRMTRAHTTIDLAEGPLLRAVLFDRGPAPARLGIVVHHLAMDGVSWGVLLQDLATAYRGDPLGAKGTSFQAWARRLHEHADEPAVWEELDHWQRQLDYGAAIPVELDGPNTEDSAELVQVRLDAETTTTLQTRVHRAYHTQINDLFLAALLRTLGRWTGSTAVRVDFESHGREPLGEDVDIVRTVGWFTSIYPVGLGSPDLDDPGRLITAVKEQLHTVPRRGVGYGLLRHVTPEPGAGGDRDRLRALRASPAPQVLFNYMGATVSGEGDGGLITRQFPEDMGGVRNGPETGRVRSHLLQVEAIQSDDGGLSLDWHYSTNVHRTGTVRRLADEFVATLHELVEHCLSPNAGSWTPSDFPMAGLDQSTLDALVRGGGKIRNG